MQKLHKKNLFRINWFMLGIVILNFNSYNYTVGCIESIQKTTKSCKKIYIIDGCSTDDSYQKLNRKYEGQPDVFIAKTDKNGGFSYGNNVGFRLAILDGCENILCTNSDVVFKENAIDKMLLDIMSNSSCAVVGPKVYCGDGTVQNCNKGRLTAFSFLMQHKPLCYFDWFGVRKRYAYLNYDYKAPLFPEMVSGCCFIIKSEILSKIGLLDENVFLYYEENILGSKIRALGLTVMLDPQAKIVHYGGKSTGENSPFLRYNNFASALYYLWVYEHVSRFQFFLVSLVTKMNFMAMSVINKEYSRYLKAIKQRIKQIKKLERK